MNKKRFLLFILLFIGKNSFAFLGMNNYYNQFIEWWKGDAISINSEHSKIFKRHIKVRGWDSSLNIYVGKETEKVSFIQDINDENFITLIDETIEKLNAYDIKIKKELDVNFCSFSDYDCSNIVEPIKKNLEEIIKILVNYKKKFKNKSGHIINVEDKNFVRLIKFFPIVENLYQIFSLILVCKDSILSLEQVYQLFKQNIQFGKIGFYMNYLDEFDEAKKYATSTVSISNIKKYEFNKKNINQVYDQVLGALVNKYTNQLSAYIYDKSSIEDLIRDGVHPEQLKQFLQLGFSLGQAMNLAKRYNMTPHTISLLSHQNIS